MNTCTHTVFNGMAGPPKKTTLHRRLQVQVHTHIPTKEKFLFDPKRLIDEKTGAIGGSDHKRGESIIPTVNTSSSSFSWLRHFCPGSTMALHQTTCYFSFACSLILIKRIHKQSAVKWRHKLHIRRVDIKKYSEAPELIPTVRREHGYGLRNRKQISPLHSGSL